MPQKEKLKIIGLNYFQGKQWVLNNCAAHNIYDMASILCNYDKPLLGIL